MLIEFLLKLPQNRVLSKIIKELLNYAKEDYFKTRNGFSIYFKKEGLLATAIRKNVITGQYESQETEVIKGLLKPGDWVIDGGAHEGYISLFMAKVVGEEGKVLSIEPNRENLNYLLKNIKINNLKNIVVVNKAISDKKEKIPFYFNLQQGAWGSTQKFSYFKSQREVMVDADNLDNISLLENAFKRVDLCKIDIEGNELKAFKGMQRIISEYKPHLIFEVSLTFWAYSNDSVDSLLNFLQERDYKIFMIKAGELQPYSWFDSRIDNLVAIHDSKIDGLRSNIFNAE